jgi:hypothetical protein
MQSTSIESMEYQIIDGQPRLDITFKTGSKYRYFGVPLSVFNLFANADSHGKFFQSNIRSQYKFEKID